MSNKAKPICPQCGAPIPEDAPQSLCPKCVLARVTPTSAATAPANRTPPPTVEEVAEHFPELEILEVIGAGGMGAVYKARQAKLERHVALKILSHDLAADPAFVERFNREARVLARLNHPNIVTIFDFGTAGLYCYLLMEFVDGVNLRQAMRAGGFTPADALAVVQDICGALSFAHEEGILHRDIKPENILIDNRGRVKIADFGIAKLIGTGSPDDVTLTLEGAMLGSPQYMAPEQIESPEDVDQRADIYSLGVVFYELLTGELPLGRFAAPSAKSSMDPRIDEIVLRTLEKERELRYQSAGEIKTQVESISRSGQAGSGDPAAAPVSSAPAAADWQPAKSATASAILTGLGLVLAGASLFAMTLFMQALDMKDYATWWLVTALVVGSLLLIGIILGAKALGEIRLSGGRKVGLGSAMFGTLAVPVLTLAGMSAATMWLVILALASARDGKVALMLAIGAAIAGPIAVVLLVRSVGRWARGDSDPAGGVSGGQVAVRIGFVFLAALLNLAVLTLGNTTLERRPGDTGAGNGDPDISKVDPRQLTQSNGGADGSGQPRKELWDLHWNDEGPHQIMQVIVPAGRAATIELVRYSAPGKETVDQRWSVLAPESENFDGVVAIGAPDSLQERQQEGVAALKGSFWSNSGGTVFLLNKFYQGKLSLRRGGGRLDLSGRGWVSRELGQFQATGASIADTFWLRVTGAARPDLGGSKAPADELFGDGSPAEVVDAWRKRHPVETDLDWSENEPEIELEFVAPAGRVTVFSLQAPWDREHESPDDWYVVAPDEGDYRGTIKIGTVGSAVIGGRKTVEILATLHDPAGEVSKSHTFKVVGDQKLSLPPSYPVFEMDDEPDGQVEAHRMQEFSGSLDLLQRGVHMAHFGIVAGSELEDNLRVLAWSVPRPDPDRAVEPAAGRLGPASPPNVVDRWIQQRQKRLNAAKAAAPQGEKILVVDDIEGAVSLRSGFLFDTREQSLGARSAIRSGESLLLRKGSKASVSLDPVNSIRLAAQTEASMIIFLQPSMWFLPPLAGLEAEVVQMPAGSELLIDTAFGAALKIRGATIFQLSSRGQLEVLEGELEVIQDAGRKTTRVTAGQEMAFPKPPNLVDSPSGVTPATKSPVEGPTARKQANLEHPRSTSLPRIRCVPHDPLDNGDARARRGSRGTRRARRTVRGLLDARVPLPAPRGARRGSEQGTHPGVCRPLALPGRDRESRSRQRAVPILPVGRAEALPRRAPTR